MGQEGVLTSGEGMHHEKLLSSGKLLSFGGGKVKIIGKAINRSYGQRFLRNNFELG